jgi:hypothetical protein
MRRPRWTIRGLMLTVAIAGLSFGTIAWFANLPEWIRTDSLVMVVGAEAFMLALILTLILFGYPRRPPDG